jgi:hypothetical protein
MVRSAWLFAGVFSLLFMIGCGGGSPSPEGGISAVEEVVGIKEVAADKLKPLGDVMPPLDSGKILISPPKDWYTLGRNSAYLAAFSHAKGSQLPLITVKGADPKVTGFSKVSAENVAEYVAALQASLAQQYGERLASNVAEPPKAMKIGENYFARYVKNAQNSQKVALHVQVLETIQGGRTYTVELQVVKGTIMEDRDFAYAVAGGLKFQGASAPVPEADDKKTEGNKEAPKEEAAKKEEPAAKE